MENFKMELNATLVTLIAQREHWENGVYKQANAELYAILEQCACIYVQLKKDKANARAFAALAEELDIKFNKGTSMALKIVRVVLENKQIESLLMHVSLSSGTTSVKVRSHLQTT